MRWLRGPLPPFLQTPGWTPDVPGTDHQWIPGHTSRKNLIRPLCGTPRSGKPVPHPNTPHAVPVPLVQTREPLAQKRSDRLSVSCLSPYFLPTIMRAAPFSCRADDNQPFHRGQCKAGGDSLAESSGLIRSGAEELGAGRFTAWSDGSASGQLVCVTTTARIHGVKNQFTVDFHPVLILQELVQLAALAVDTDVQCVQALLIIQRWQAALTQPFGNSCL